MERPIITLRIDAELNSYLHARAAETGLTITEICATLLRVGLENRRESHALLERRRLLAVECARFRDADAEIRNALKKGYIVENFKKLFHRIRMARDMTDARKQAIVDAMLQRIEDTLGKDSPEYQETLTLTRPRGGKGRSEEHDGDKR